MGRLKYFLTFFLLCLIAYPVFPQDAGDDQVVCGSLTTTLDGNNPGGDSGLWTLVEPAPGTESFEDETAYNTDVTVSTYGSYTFRWTVNGTDYDDVVINFVDPPVATAIHNGPVCVGLGLTLTGGPNNMQSYSWTGPDGFTSSLQNVTVSSSATTDMAGDYTLEVTDAYGCKGTAVTNVVVNTLPAVTADNNGPICEGNLLELYGGPGGMASYYWTGPDSFTSTDQNSVVSGDATLSMAGEYTLLVVDNNGCQNTANTDVTVNSLPNATISGTLDVCKGDPQPQVLFTGSLGTAPYTFTYKINGGPDQYVTTSGGNSVAVSVPTGNVGVYTYSLVNVQDANCERTIVGPGNSATITVNPLPMGTISGTTAVCQFDPSPSVTFTGSGGTPPYTFTYSVNSGGSQTISTVNGNSTISISVPTDVPAILTYSLFRVEDASDSECSQIQGGSATITINAMPTATISGSTEVCQGSPSPNVVFTGSNGIRPYTFTYTINGGSNQTISTTSSSNSVSLTVSTGTPSTFTYELVSVSDGSSTSCEQSQSGTAVVTVNPSPDATISGTAEVCRYDPEPVIIFTGSGGSPPYEFTYTINSGPGYVVVTTSGSSVSLPVPTGNVGSFTYTLLKVEDSSTGCSRTIGGSATVTVNPLPLANISGTTAVCRNSESPLITFTGSNGSTPYTFTYKVNNGTEQTVTTESGSSSVTVPVPTVTVGTYLYELVSVEDGSSSVCSQIQTGSATVTVNPLPTASISGTTTVCRNDTPPLVTFTGASGTTPYTFTYTINSGPEQTVTTLSGNSVTVAALTGTAGVFTYELIRVWDASSTACEQAQSGSAIITVNPLPATSPITGNQTPACEATGETYSVTLTPGSTYSWIVPEGAVITSGANGPNNNTITVDFGASNGYISVIETNTNGCTGAQVDLAISLQGCELNANFSVNNTSVCSGSSVTFIDLSTGASGSTTYSWDFGAGSLPSTATGIGPHTVTYTGSGTSTVSLTITDGATDTETKIDYITINALPTATISGTTDVCVNAPSPGITFTGLTGTPPFTFTYSVNGGTEQTVTTTSGNSITVPAPTWDAGDFTYELISVRGGSVNACEQSQTGSAVITVHPLPSATIEGTTSVCVNDPAPEITFTGSEGTEPYSFTYTINGGDPLTVTTVIGNSISIPASTGTAGIYTYELVSVQDGGVTECSQVMEVSAVITVNETPVANAGSGGEVCDLHFELNAIPDISTGTWIMTSGTGSASFYPDANDPNAIVTVTEYGLKEFSWTEVNGSCSDVATIEVTFFEVPVANPGSGGEVCNRTFNLNAVPGIGTGTWTMTSGTGTATFSPNANAPDAIVEVSIYGIKEFTWTVGNGPCTESAPIEVTFYQPPVANAGTGGNNCGLYFNLDAVPSRGTGTWILADGPGSATFTPSADQPEVTVLVDTYGTYEFTWTEENGPCSDSESIEVRFFEIPAANAGLGGEECDLDFKLHALIVNGGGSWSLFTGPGNASFNPSADDPDAVVTVDAYGTYQFAWTEINAVCQSSDLIQVIFRPVPEVSAGRDTIICLGDTVRLQAVGEGIFNWEPSALLDSPSIHNPRAFPDISTTYRLVLTDQYGCVNDDEVEVVVLEPPIAYAGPDQELDYVFETQLNAVLGLYEKGTWAVIEGSGTIANDTVPVTTISDLALNENVLMWTVTNEVCPSSSDNLVIMVNDLIIPTLITPNLDGKNDYFVLRGIATLGRTELIIFDRRGALVYENNNYDNRWDGVDQKGNLLPDGTYFYTIRPTNGKAFSGYIVIQR